MKRGEKQLDNHFLFSFLFIVGASFAENFYGLKRVPLHGGKLMIITRLKSVVFLVSVYLEALLGMSVWNDILMLEIPVYLLFSTCRFFSRTCGKSVNNCMNICQNPILLSTRYLLHLFFFVLFLVCFSVMGRYTFEVTRKYSAA